MNSLFGEFFKDLLPDFLRIFWPDFWPGFWPGFLVPKYSVQVYWDGEIQGTVLPGQRKETIHYLLFEIQKIPISTLGTL